MEILIYISVQNTFKLQIRTYESYYIVYMSRKSFIVALFMRINNTYELEIALL